MWELLHMMWRHVGAMVDCSWKDRLSAVFGVNIFVVTVGIQCADLGKDSMYHL